MDITFNNSSNSNISVVGSEKVLSDNYYEEVIFTEFINFSTNQENIQSISGITTNDQRFLLLGQTDTDENGIYKRTNSANIKETPTKNTVYYNNTKMGLYNIDEDLFMISYSRKVILQKNFETLTNDQVDVFNIPNFGTSTLNNVVPFTVDLELIGIGNTISTSSIKLTNVQSFTNNTTNIFKMGDFGSEIVRNGSLYTGSTLPTITYDINSTNSNIITLKVTPNVLNIRWKARAVVTF